MEHRRPGRPPKGPFERAQYKIPAELAAAIRYYAAAHGMTMTDLVCEAVADRIGVPYHPQTRLSVVLDEGADTTEPGGLAPQTRAAVDEACGRLGLSRLEFVEAALRMALARPEELVQALEPARPTTPAPQPEVAVTKSA